MLCAVGLVKLSQFEAAVAVLRAHLVPLVLINTHLVVDPSNITNHTSTRAIALPDKALAH